MTKSYYDILEVGENATQKEIRQSYRKLVLQWHPDKNPGNKEAEEKTKKLNEAYEILGDETKRAKYNNSQSVAVEKYGYDYGEEVPDGESAISKYTDTNSIDAMNEAWGKLFGFYILLSEEREKNPVSDYHLIRARNMLKVLDSYYKAKYLAAKNENERGEVIRAFNFWDHGSGLSNQKNWQNNFERCLRMINYARNHLGLNSLTESDLNLKPIKGPNETPKIPDNGERPQEIEGGKFSDYNKLYSGRNHETIRKYERLYEEIIAKFHSGSKYEGWSWNQEGYDKLRSVNPTLFEETYEKKMKEIGTGGFAFIPHDADSDKEREFKELNEEKINKMKEAINLMERLIEENKNYKPATGNVLSQGQKGSEEIKAIQDNAKKDEESAAKLNNALQGLSDDKTDEEKERELKNIESLKNQGGFYEQQKDLINGKKDELAKSDPVGYGRMIARVIQQKMKEFKVEITKLGNEIKEKLTKLQNGEFTSDTEVRAIEEEVSDKVSEEVANVELNSLLTQANKILKTSAKNLQSQLRKMKKDLYGFAKSNNPFQQKVYQQQKTKVEEALKGLENLSNTTEPTGVSPWKIIVPISLAVVLVIAIVAVIKVRRKKHTRVK